MRTGTPACATGHVATYPAHRRPGSPDPEPFGVSSGRAGPLVPQQRTVGVEEELLLVDAESGRPAALAAKVIARTHSLLGPSEVPDGREATGGHPGGTVTEELKQEQLETDTPPRTSMADLEADLRRMRSVVATAAHQASAVVVATGTSPVPVRPELVPDERYEAIVRHVGITASEHLTCGCHVHVGVASDDEGVVALNGIRPWLPTLLAYSANSPFWQGEDTAYASFRAQLMARWPATGPHELFTSGAQYRATAEKMVRTGVLLDTAMLYFDARLSSRYPTLELRVADVCLDVRDAVVVAALARALVDTAVAAHAAGVPPDAVPTSMLRLATWQASRAGLGGDLLDPFTSDPRPAADVVGLLLAHVRGALEANGDLARVESRTTQVLATGTGAHRQREVLDRTHDLADVVRDLARATSAGTGPDDLAL